MDNRRTPRVFVVLAALAVVAVGALGVSASAFADRSAKCGSVTMDENAWAGATANVYVLKYVLEKNLGCKVNIEKLPESTPLFQAMADGKVDVVPEDWNNIDLKVNQKFIKSGKLIESRLERRHRAHRLVHPDLPAEAAPRAQELDGAQEELVALQDGRLAGEGSLPRR